MAALLIGAGGIANAARRIVTLGGAAALDEGFKLLSAPIRARSSRVYSRVIVVSSAL